MTSQHRECGVKTFDVVRHYHSSDSLLFYRSFTLGGLYAFVIGAAYLL
jgi:hypothetical protein